jgi:hypothetical protein
MDAGFVQQAFTQRIEPVFRRQTADGLVIWSIIRKARIMIKQVL